MTFDEFIGKWKGKTIDFDGIYPNMCMDLMHFYVYECLGLTDKTLLASPSASQVYTDFKPEWGKFFEKIDNTPSGVPARGDILFFGTQIGPYGHVCIFYDGDANNFRSFDANWPVGTLPHLQNHDYNGVLGWLRFKPQEQEVTLSKDTFETLVFKSTQFDKFKEQGYENVSQVNAKLDELKAKIVALEERVRLFEQNDVIQEGTIKGFKAEVDILNTKLSTCESELVSRPIVEPLKQFYFFGHKVWVF